MRVSSYLSRYYGPYAFSMLKMFCAFVECYDVVSGTNEHGRNNSFVVEADYCFVLLVIIKAFHWQSTGNDRRVSLTTSECCHRRDPRRADVIDPP